MRNIGLFSAFAFALTFSGVSLAQEAAPSDSAAMADTTATADDSVRVVVVPPDTQVVEMVELAAEDAAKAPATAPKPEPVSVINKTLESIDLGGRIQFKGFYHDMTAEQDADKRLSFQLRRLSLDVGGRFANRSGFKMEALLETNDQKANLNAAYLFHDWNEHWGIRAGKMKRPISQEALQSSKKLYTVERGTLYHDFLSKTTGYIMQDIGIILNGGFDDDGIPVGYQLGVFNGKNPDAAQNYSNQHLESTDRGFKAKDVVLRAHAQPFPELFVEGAFATKGGEDKSDAADFEYRMNTAYQFGAAWSRERFKLLGEMAWGDNHQGRDDFIGVDSLSTTFFAFYLTGIWRNEYPRNRASELVAKVEGLDPDTRLFWQDEDGRPNDTRLRYYVGSNYYFNAYTGVQLGYAVTHPITEVVGEGDLRHDIEFMWRMFF